MTTPLVVNYNSCTDSQPLRIHALSYEVAVFNDQSLSVTQMKQYTLSTDSRLTLEPYDEVDEDNHNQLRYYRDNESSSQRNGESHLYTMR